MDIQIATIIIIINNLCLDQINFSYFLVYIFLTGMLSPLLYIIHISTQVAQTMTLLIILEIELSIRFH